MERAFRTAAAAAPTRPDDTGTVLTLPEIAAVLELEWYLWCTARRSATRRRNFLIGSARRSYEVNLILGITRLDTQN